MTSCWYVWLGFHFGSGGLGDIVDLGDLVDLSRSLFRWDQFGPTPITYSQHSLQGNGNLVLHVYLLLHWCFMCAPCSIALHCIGLTVHYFLQLSQIIFKTSFGGYHQQRKMTPDTWHRTTDTWHMTHGTWHVTHDTQGWWTFFLILCLAHMASEKRWL